MHLSFYKLTELDLPFLNETRNGYAPEYLHDSRTFTIQETLDWYIKTNPDYWIIFDDDINEKVGYFRLSNYSSTNKNIYIGADISIKFKNKGYGTEAYNRFIPFLFEKYDLHKITLEVLETNLQAIHLYEKLGFFREGLKRHDVCKNGNWVNSIIMSMLNPKEKLVSVAISSYFGKRSTFHEKIKTDPLFYIRKNIEYINKLDTKVEKIYIICTFSPDADRQQILKNLKAITVNDNRVVLRTKTNFGGSYSSWHYALELDAGYSDYIVLIEDDYVLYDKNSISNMVEYWNDEPNMIYLCTKFAYIAAPIKHAAISNGMINNKLYNNLKKYKDLDFYLEEFVDGITNHYEILWKNQTFFLKNYSDANIKIRDFSEKYSAYFINTDTEFGVENGKMIFAPISERFVE